ncbi:MAG: hypothetical protein JO257_23985 [Deltaproteobacteria bacterium]|nr:hypothetical protein [Deltaproteobacteria bacterium]
MKWLVLLALSLAACDSCNDAVRHTPDSHVVDARADAPADVASLFDASDPNSTVLITQSPPGPTNTDPATWGGVLQFQVAGDGTSLVAGTGIAKTSVEDPVSLAFKSATSEVFVGNRHGNNAADGTAGSISRFAYVQSTHALTARPEITGNGLDGVHQVAFSPTTGELFAANQGNGVSRFTFDAAGTPVANGMIGSGTTRGVFVAPDGKRLYVSTASNVIRQFDLATGNELTAVTLQTTGNLHFFAIRTGELYVAALDDNIASRSTRPTSPRSSNRSMRARRLASRSRPTAARCTSPAIGRATSSSATATTPAPTRGHPPARWTSAPRWAAS